MQSPKILAQGRFKPEDLEISVSESNRKIDPAIEEQLESIWEAKVKKAEEQGKVKIDFGIIEYKISQIFLKRGLHKRTKES